MYDLAIVVEARLLNRFGNPATFLRSTIVKETFVCEDIKEVFRISDQFAKEFEIVSASFKKIKDVKKDEREDEC